VSLHVADILSLASRVERVEKRETEKVKQSRLSLNKARKLRGVVSGAFFVAFFGSSYV